MRKLAMLTVAMLVLLAGLAQAGIDATSILHRPYTPEDRLPWDHIGIRQGGRYLEQEYRKALAGS